MFGKFEANGVVVLENILTHLLTKKFLQVFKPIIRHFRKF